MIENLKKCVIVFSNLASASNLLVKEEWEEVVKNTCWSIYMASEITRIHKRVIKSHSGFNTGEFFPIMIYFIFKFAKEFLNSSSITLSPDKSFISDKYEFLRRSLMRFFTNFSKVYFKSKYFMTTDVEEIIRGRSSSNF